MSSLSILEEDVPNWYLSNHMASPNSGPDYVLVEAEAVYICGVQVVLSYNI